MQKQVMLKLQNIDFIRDQMKKGLSRNQILKELNWSSRKLTTFCYRHNLRIPKISNIFPNDEQTQVIIGSLLGDGCVSYSGKYSKSARLQIHHCIEQLEYAKYKYNILMDLCKSGISIKTRHDERFKITDYEQCSFKTRSLKVFSNYRKRWYPNNKKELGISNVWDIEPLGLAIWFMDDGTKELSGVSFATIGFSIEDVTLLQIILKRKFDLETRIRADKTLYIRKRSLMDFINLINPYVIDSMKYKIRVT